MFRGLTIAIYTLKYFLYASCVFAQNNIVQTLRQIILTSHDDLTNKTVQEFIAKTLKPVRHVLRLYYL